MTIYINPNGEYPRFYGDIQAENPNWNLGDSLPEGWIQVEDNPMPMPEYGKVVDEGFPIESEGTYSRNWIIRDMTAEEIERRDAPETAKAKLMALGLTEVEVRALVQGLVR